MAAAKRRVAVEDPHNPVKFTRTQKDERYVSRIVSRAITAGYYLPSERVHATMDLVACHANGNPMRFKDLFEADDFNFAHDVCGIRNCLDRNTGRLLKDFSPRFSDVPKRRAIRNG